MGIPIRVLIVEDSVNDTELVLRQLRRAGYDPVSERVQTAEAMKTALEREAWDLVVSDYSMPQFDAPTALNLLNRSGRDVPFIVVSGSIGEDIAATMMKTGAHDYILKQNLTRFVPAVQRELREAENRRQQRLTEQAKQRLQVERDEFLERLKQENDDLTALTQVTANAVSTLDLDELLRVLLGRVIDVMHADTATILLADGAELHVRASVGVVNLSDSTHVKHVGQCFAGSVASRMKPVYVEDAAVDPLITDPLIWERGIRSMLGVPLKRNGTLVGVLHVDWLTVRPCRDREVHLLEITGERCASAIQNAQLYQESKRIAAALTESEARLRAIFDTEPECVKLMAADGSLLEMNPAGLRLLEADSFQQIENQCVFPLVVEEHRRAFRDLTGRVFRGESGTLEFEIIGLKGRQRWLETHASPLRDAAGKVTALLGITRDITERKLAERQRAGELRVFELLARGAPLSECLDRLARECEELWAGMMCSILLLDADGRHLRHGAAPSLPTDYINAIDGMEIGPSVGSCGTAAHTGRTVIVSDIATDPLWADFKELALSHGLRACWSVPILGEGGRVLGTYAMYYQEPRAPQPEELAAYERAAYLASLAILRHQNLEALRQSEARFRGLFQAAPDAILIVNRQRTITLANPAAETLFGYGSGELSGRIIEDLVPVSARQRHVAHYNGYTQHPKARRMGSGMDLKGCRKDGTEFSVDVILAPLELSGELFTLCIARDITERKRTEEALHKSHEHYRRVIEDIFKFVPEALLVFARNLNLYKDNKAFDDLVRTYAPKLNYTEPELRELLLNETRAIVLSGEAGEIRIPSKNRDEQGTRRPDHSGEGVEPPAP